MIVQFREADGQASCVIYGEHGYALNVNMGEEGKQNH